MDALFECRFDRDFAPQSELRYVAETNTISGLAVPYGVLSNDFGAGFREIIMPGAFAESLRSGADVMADVEHERLSRKIGRTGAGTLRLRDETRGLFVEITPPATTVGKDTIEEVRSGLLHAFSFGFKVARPGGEKFYRRADGTIREVHRAALKDITLTSFPAYPQTSVALRSMEAAQASLAAWQDDERRAEITARARDRLRRAMLEQKA